MRTMLTCACRDAIGRRACQKAESSQRPPQRAASRTEPARAPRGSARTGPTPSLGGRRSGTGEGPSRNSRTIAGGTAEVPCLRLSSTSGPADRRSPARPARGKARRARRAPGRRRTRAGKGRAGSPPAPLSPTPTAPGGWDPRRTHSSRLSRPHHKVPHLLQSADHKDAAAPTGFRQRPPWMKSFSGFSHGELVHHGGRGRTPTVCPVTK